VCECVNIHQALGEMTVGHYDRARPTAQRGSPVSNMICRMRNHTRCDEMSLDEHAMKSDLFSSRRGSSVS